MLVLVQRDDHFLGVVSFFWVFEIISDITSSFRSFIVPSAPMLEINSVRALLEAISLAAESSLFQPPSGGVSNNSWIFAFI